MRCRPSRKPASGHVKPALFGQKQRLLQLACRRGQQRLKAAAFKLPVGRIAGSRAGNNTPPDHPAPMLHLKPGKLSGRGAAHSIDSRAQMPRHALTMPGPGTCGVLAGPPRAGYQLPCCSPLDLCAGHDGQPGAGGSRPAAPAFRANIVPAGRGVQRLRPRLDYELHATGLGRNELGALPVATGLAAEHALTPLWP
jgi:hypothetical protein